MTAQTVPNLSRFRQAFNQVDQVRVSGRIVQVVGLTIEAVGMDCQIGEICAIQSNDSPAILAEVVGFKGERGLLMPLGDMEGIQPGSQVTPLYKSFRTPVGPELLGRVLDGLGNPIDGKGSLSNCTMAFTNRTAPDPMTRKPVESQL
jgi:flagellum-specific ATP synthase